MNAHPLSAAARCDENEYYIRSWLSSQPAAAVTTQQNVFATLSTGTTPNKVGAALPYREHRRPSVTAEPLPNTSLNMPPPGLDVDDDPVRESSTARQISQGQGNMHTGSHHIAVACCSSGDMLSCVWWLVNAPAAGQQREREPPRWVCDHHIQDFYHFTMALLERNKRDNIQYVEQHQRSRLELLDALRANPAFADRIPTLTDVDCRVKQHIAEPPRLRAIEEAAHAEWRTVHRFILNSAPKIGAVNLQVLLNRVWSASRGLYEAKVKHTTYDSVWQQGRMSGILHGWNASLLKKDELPAADSLVTLKAAIIEACGEVHALDRTNLDLNSAMGAMQDLLSTVRGNNIS